MDVPKLYYLWHHLGMDSTELKTYNDMVIRSKSAILPRMKDAGLLHDEARLEALYQGRQFATGV